MKRGQTIAQRRKLQRLTLAAEQTVAAKQQAYDAAPSRLREVRRADLVKAVARALKLERAS